MSDAQPNDLQTWLSALAQTSTLIELVVLAACALLAWLLTNLVAKAFVGRDANSIAFGRRIIDGVLFPALWLSLAYLVRKPLSLTVHLAAFKIAIPVLLSLLVIRVGVKVLQVAFKETPLIRLLERTISWLAWLVMVLWVSGLLPVVMSELDDINWKVGGTTMSVRKIIEGSLTAGLVLIIT
ncbi:MAG TPA: mechanosensitive ion channel protein, partial [Rhodoferax sp.]